MFINSGKSVLKCFFQNLPIEVIIWVKAIVQNVYFSNVWKVMAHPVGAGLYAYASKKAYCHCLTACEK